MSKLIPLTRGQFATVDDHWFERLSRYSWQCTKDGYASMSGEKHVYMHRLVSGTPKGLEADHINRNRLDNREQNLRNVTHAENQKNRGSRHTARVCVGTIQSTEPQGPKIILGAHFDIPEANEIKATADRADLTTAQLIRRAVREYVNRYCPSENTIAPLEVQEQVAA